MTIWPLGAVRVLRRYALVAVLLATIYLYVELLRQPIGSVTKGAWGGFWPATDFVIAAAVSFVPLASDYSRHSRTVRKAFAASFLGYSVTQIAYYTLGLVALATVVRSDAVDLQHDMFASFIAVPVGWLAFAVLTLRELDQAFADTYSTVISTQNVFPRFDRRVLAIVVGVASTVLALRLNINSYVGFLYLLGSAFVPMFAVFVVDYFVLGGRRRWNLSESAPERWIMVVPWLLGIAMYQLVYAPDVGAWDSWWATVRTWLHFTWHSWMSASVLSFAVAAVATLLVAPFSRRTAQR
jgi:purine-cytosine permease-like protein